jgi:hypothetical protein
MRFWLNRVLTRSARRKRFVAPKRAADVQVAVLKEVIEAVAAQNKKRNWTFEQAGFTQLTDDFMLLFEYMRCYDAEDVRAMCDRFGAFFLSAEQQAGLKNIEDEEQRKQAGLDILKPIIRPAWLFFVALCHVLQQGEENDLTAEDACWLGLIDEVIGQDDPLSLRDVVEWEPESDSASGTQALEPPGDQLAVTA